MKGGGVLGVDAWIKLAPIRVKSRSLALLPCTTTAFYVKRRCAMRGIQSTALPALLMKKRQGGGIKNVPRKYAYQTRQISSCDNRLWASCGNWLNNPCGIAHVTYLCHFRPACAVKVSCHHRARRKTRKTGHKALNKQPSSAFTTFSLRRTYECMR